VAGTVLPELLETFVMEDKKKTMPNPQPDEHVRKTQPMQKNPGQSNNNRNTGAINSGNTINRGQEGRGGDLTDKR